MSSHLTKELSEIEKALDWQNFKIAQNKLEKLKEKELTNEEVIVVDLLYSKNFEKFNPDERLKFAEEALVKSRELDNQKLVLKSLIEIISCKIGASQFNESLAFIEKTEKLLALQKEKKSLLEIQAKLLYFKGKCLTRIGKLELGFEVLQEGEKLAKQISEKKVLADIYFYMGINKGHVENYKLGIELGLKTREIAIQLDHKVLEADCHVLIGAYYQWTGKYSIAKVFFEDGIKILKKINKKIDEFYYRLGLNHYFLGELEKAVEMFEKSLNKANSRSPRYKERRNVFWGEGLLAWKKGELDQAIDHMERCLEISSSVGDKYHTNLNSIFLAAIYFDKGRITEALDLTHKALDNLPSKSQNYSIGLAHQLLGKIYQVKGKLNLALHHAQQSLSIQTKMEVTHHLVETILLLINISVDKGKLNLANNYLEKLRAINEEIDSEYFKQTYDVGRALILKSQQRPKNWLKAIEIFESVVRGELTNHSLTVFAMINLCELLINEFSISGDIEVLLELEEYTETLAQIAKNQNVFNLRLEAYNIRLLTLWLKAQYSIVDVDIQKAKNLLAQVLNIADEEGLILLAEKITQQQGTMFKRMENWDDFIRKYYEFLKG